MDARPSCPIHMAKGVASTSEPGWDVMGIARSLPMILETLGVEVKDSSDPDLASHRARR